MLSDAPPYEQRSAGTPEAPTVALLTGCQDRPYALNWAIAIAARGMRLEVIGSDEVDSPELHETPNLRFLNIRRRFSPYAPVGVKLRTLATYYLHLIAYVARSKPRILHILWNNKFEVVDRTVLMLYYKLCGKKISFTAHNVNQAKRDMKDSWLNRFTLRIQYRLCNHIFVHTQRMKDELRTDFGISEPSITVLRHPLNDVFPDTDLTPATARELLGFSNAEKIVLFFGRLRPYKGIEYLLASFQRLLAKDSGFRLIVAGAPNKGDEPYLKEIRKLAESELSNGRMLLRSEFIPDKDVELYLKAADVLVLPYKDIFQSGVLFLSYTFGLPVVATDVGSFREEIVEGETGFICKPGDPEDLAAALERFFSSPLYQNLGMRRQDIKNYARRVHSWSAVAELTSKAFAQMLADTPAHRLFPRLDRRSKHDT